jgi:carbon-monoxide dehydrogenase large subunit
MKEFSGRREDDRFVGGHGRYTSDWSLPAQLHAVFRRSDLAHARIGSVHVSAAAALPGVHAVLTASDFPQGFGTISPAMSPEGRAGTRLQVPERPVPARERVRFVGEEIALVVADSPQLAADAAERIEIDYDEIAAVTGLDAALRAGAPRVHDDIAGNLCFDFDYGDEHATQALLERAAHRIRTTVESPRVSAAPMEPRAVLAWYDAARDTYEIRCSNQGGDLMAEQLAFLLRTGRERIRVHPVDVGGGFGPRAGAYSEYALLLDAARRLGRPIKWTGTRSEDFLCDAQGRGIRVAGELGLDASGRFLALRTEWTCDQGAYLTYAGPRTNTGNGKLIGAGPYVVEALYGRHRLAFTNTSPTDAYRGAARPEAALLIERLVDEAALHLRIDPMELRRRNAVGKEAFPYQTLTGSILDSGDYAALLDAARRASAWDAFPARQQRAAERGAIRGIGCALFVEPCGGGFLGEDQVALVFAGGEILAHVATTSNGQGHETVFPALIAARLGIDAARVTLRSSDPDGPAIRGNGTIGSRSTLAQGSALSLAADKAVDKGKALAAELLEAPVADIGFAAGRYTVRGTDLGVTFDAVMRRAAELAPNPLDTLLSQPAPRTFTSGAHVAEVEIDRDTGATSLVAYLAVDDIGTVINPVLAHGQIHGGVAQAAGQVLGEQCVYDSHTGQLLTGSFMDYAMLRADGLPAIASTMLPTASTTNVLGAKGAGETGSTGGLPALMNALLNALRSAGVTDFDMPASPQRVWAALRNSRR